VSFPLFWTTVLGALFGALWALDRFARPRRVGNEARSVPDGETEAKPHGGRVMVPWAFRSRPPALRRLRVAAVGVALAGITMRAFAEFVPPSSSDPTSNVALWSGPFTLLCGCLWAALLDGGRTRRVGVRRWLASVPLAMANAALTLGSLAATDREPPFWGFFGCAALGATFGVVIWGPALILTLLFLGLPIHVANTMAKEGLAGEDRGDAIVGLACAGLGLAVLLPIGDAHVALPAEVWTQRAAGVLACLLAGAVLAAAGVRGARRRALLRDVESGRRCDYRVATTSDGRLLARVRATSAGYRVADVEEPICELDESGRCLQSLASE
jgi:hypothetical protein